MLPDHAESFRENGRLSYALSRSVEDGQPITRRAGRPKALAGTYELFSALRQAESDQGGGRVELADIEYAMVHIGERISEARKGRGLAARDLGMFTGVTEHTVRSWEASESRPVLWQVLEVAARCEVTADWLLGRDLIEEFLLAYDGDIWLCPAVSPEDLPLNDLDTIREFICHAKGWKRRSSSPAGRTALSPGA